MYFSGEFTNVSISLYINRISAVDENKEVKKFKYGYEDGHEEF